MDIPDDMIMGYNALFIKRHIANRVPAGRVATTGDDIVLAQ